jgi:hypothetical protein
VVKPDGTLVPRDELELPVAEEEISAPTTASPAVSEPERMEPTAVLETGTALSELSAAADHGPSQSTAEERRTSAADNARPQAGRPETADAATAGTETAAALAPQSPVEMLRTESPAEPSASGLPQSVETGLSSDAETPSRQGTGRADPITPERAPVAPPRPSAQPAAGIVESTQLAAAAPDVWSMQIASQPSAEAAQQTYVNLAQRYGSVLNGHGVNIVKAEISGKGTFYRVRIPTDSRNEAVALCERYKAAGGSCFVAR